MKNIKNYRNHIWLLVLTLLFAAACSIMVFNNQTPLVLGLCVFVFGLGLIYVGVKLAPIGKENKIFTGYTWMWHLSIFLTMALTIFWGLYIPHKAATWLIVVVILVWYALVWLLGLFFIHTCNVLGEDIA